MNLHRKAGIEEEFTIYEDQIKEVA